MKRTVDKLNWKEPDTGLVHLASFGGDGEYTLCGFAYDEPSVEYGQSAMVPTDEPCTCRECTEIARKMLPYLKKETKRIREVRNCDFFEEKGGRDDTDI